MVGSKLASRFEGVAVCDIAVPLRPHSSSAVDRIATAEDAMKPDDNLMTISSPLGRDVSWVKA
jgi:hypothetical protein